ncbi:MAG: 50S ribosomal protein L29 [Bacteroidales bacterium]|nr:50S ribosomal protein L29 [Bacteroidales bacterium]HOY38301.1 50S ribosomal protein L29 [Bacteroidales bacterium]HQP04638.1 50S ribosomal protein L29 [Bacteroidales bacterium]
MKNTEIRELSEKEIIERIEETKASLIRLKMNHVVSPLDNPQKLVQVKRTIARLNTELRKRQLQNKK